jgi:hypothetical protein
MVVLLFACWCMAVAKPFAVLLVFKSLCGVVNTDDIFTEWPFQISGLDPTSTPRVFCVCFYNHARV